MSVNDDTPGAENKTSHYTQDNKTKLKAMVSKIDMF